MMERIYAIEYENGRRYMNLTLPDAVVILLDEGGHKWEIRYHDGLYSLWTTRPSAFADTHGYAEEQHYWGLSKDAVMKKLIGTTRGNATLLPMTMILKGETTDDDQD